jgi:hypothetical protein
VNEFIGVDKYKMHNIYIQEQEAVLKEETCANESLRLLQYQTYEGKILEARKNEFHC